MNNILHVFEPLEGSVIFSETNEVKRGRNLDPNNGGSLLETTIIVTEHVC